MSIVLKRGTHPNINITERARTFPLAAGCEARNIDMVSSQSICFRCARKWKKTIYNEPLGAILPIVQYSGANKRFLDYQLSVALALGLNKGFDGAAQNVQIFMTMLD